MENRSTPLSQPGKPPPASRDLRVEGVEKSFGPAPVLRGMSLDARSGEFVTLLGPSGCGKTTPLGEGFGGDSFGGAKRFAPAQVVARHVRQRVE